MIASQAERWIDFQPPPKRFLIGAIILSFFLHGALAALFYTRASDDAAEDSAPASVEISLVVQAPKDTPSDQPIGPSSDASIAAPDASQTPPPPSPDPPSERETQTNDAPEQVANAVEKPQETPPAPPEQTASIASQAANASAPPPLDAALESMRSAAPMIEDAGVKENRERQRATWQKQLLAHLNRHKRYPENGVRKNIEVVVAFSLDRSGHIVAAHILRSCGDEKFDEAALATLRRADPAPVPPHGLYDSDLSFTLPMIYKISGR